MIQYVNKNRNYFLVKVTFQTGKWDNREDTDLLETFSKYLNLELQFVKNDQPKRDGKTEIIEILTENVKKCK